MIIGISGKAGAGKDTYADFLVKNHGFVKVSLADPLKRICRDVFDFSDEQMWGPSEKRNEPDKRYPHRRAVIAWPRDCANCKEHYEATPGSTPPEQCPKCGSVKYTNQSNRFGVEYLTPRYALQRLGTQWGRDCYENVWVDYVLRVANKLLDPDGVREQKTVQTYTGDIAQEWNYTYDAKRWIGAPILTARAPKIQGVVIPDVRFKNEVDAINAAGGKVLRIFRPGAGLIGEAGQHISETELDDDEENLKEQGIFGGIINDGTLAELEKMSDATYEILKNLKTL